MPYFLKKALWLSLATSVLLSLACESKHKISADLNLKLKLAPAATLVEYTEASGVQNLFDIDPDTIDFMDGANNPDRIQIEALARSIIPESLLFQIGSISTLESLSGYAGMMAYACPGTTSTDCMVDLTDAEAVASFLAKGKVALTRKVSDDESKIGTISAFRVGQCLPGESKGRIKFKGKTTFMGRTWYTTASDKVLTANEEDYDYITMDSNGCMSGAWILPPPVSVNKGDALTVSLFVNLTDIAKMRFYTGGNNTGACKNGTLRVGCIDDPKAVPYIGDANTTAEIYTITTTDTAVSDTYKVVGSMILFIDPVTREPLGATTRSRFDGNNAPWTHGPGDIASITKNSDGSYSISAMESDGTSTPVITTTFKRDSHAGTFRMRADSGSGTMDWNYIAVKN